MSTNAGLGIFLDYRGGHSGLHRPPYIKQTADNAMQTEKNRHSVGQYMEESGKVVAQTVIAMQQIAKKISIIQQIADQTRMLSLNATIEAAQAQDHGKAFSVVAAKVRKLSDITKAAAEEINELAPIRLTTPSNNRIASSSKMPPLPIFWHTPQKP